ncbi:unnamed protein product [Vicia faba]|uniref:Uncharacterized protein n=1 Tax=Vicia faba TaxID=3906 RepID=A0AAV1BDU9_VICFA|nr:unnamed protein product [Vicia faba]
MASNSQSQTHCKTRSSSNSGTEASESCNIQPVKQRRKVGFNFGEPALKRRMSSPKATFSIGRFGKLCQQHTTKKYQQHTTKKFQQQTTKTATKCQQYTATKCQQHTVTKSFKLYNDIQIKFIETCDRGAWYPNSKGPLDNMANGDTLVQ